MDGMILIGVIIFFLGIGIVAKLITKAIIGTGVVVSSAMKTAADKFNDNSQEIHLNPNIRNITLLTSKLINTSQANFDKKIKIIVEWLKINIQLDDVELNLYGQHFDEKLKSDSSEWRLATISLYQSFSNDKNILIAIINLLFKIAIVDGEIDDKEEAIIRNVCSVFKISDYEYQSIKRFFTGKNESGDMTNKEYKNENIFDILGCKKTDSMEHISNAYNELLNKYDPDKILAKGLDDEFVNYSKKKIIQLHKAYIEIKKERKLS